LNPYKPILSEQAIRNTLQIIRQVQDYLCDLYVNKTATSFSHSSYTGDCNDDNDQNHDHIQALTII